MQRMVLLNPGPVNVTDRVRQALMKEDMCHREPEMTALLQSIRRKLIQAFDLEGRFTAVLVSGSGTAALEMGVSSFVSEGRSLLVIRNGVYGERIAAMAEAYRFPLVTLDYDWGEPPRLEDVESALKSNPDIEGVAMVHHETTTGLLNPIHEVGELAHKYGKKFLVDSISGLGGDAIDFDRSQVDFCIGTANKCLQGFPGVSFVLVRNGDWDRLGKMPPRSIYFNLARNFQAQEKGDTLFTPSIQVHYAFEAALEELLEETVAGRIARYRNAAGFLRKGFRSLDLEFLVPESHLSNTLTSLKLPEGLTYEHLHDQLRERGFVIYAGQGGLSKKIFRIANMGDITEDEFKKLLVALKQCLTAASDIKEKP